MAFLRSLNSLNTTKWPDILFIRMAIETAETSAGEEKQQFLESSDRHFRQLCDIPARHFAESMLDDIVRNASDTFSLQFQTSMDQKTQRQNILVKTLKDRFSDIMRASLQQTINHRQTKTQKLCEQAKQDIDVHGRLVSRQLDHQFHRICQDFGRTPEEIEARLNGDKNIATIYEEKLHALKARAGSAQPG